jgi:hypothetical protein
LLQIAPGYKRAVKGVPGALALPERLVPPLLLGQEGHWKGTRMKTHHEHVQAVREGRDYKSPTLAINETIDHLVDCALIVKNQDAPLTAETRALDAIGVQVARELKTRSQMIHALTDRLQVVENELLMANAQYESASRRLAELERGKGTLHMSIPA